VPTIQSKLSPTTLPGQIGHRPLGLGGVQVLLLFLLGFALAGCGSIYHETLAVLPQEPTAQLRFRIEEAQQAESLSRQAITTLRDGIVLGKPSIVTETDGDRMAAAAFDFDRRVAAARDAAAHCAFDPQLTRELERLQGRSRKLLDYVKAMNAHRGSINSRQLDDLLNDLARP
jgi:hypothetical protein